MPEREILRVTGNIKEIYSKYSKIYAIIEEYFEKNLRKKGLLFLNIQESETVLEIGFGTGSMLVEIAKGVGNSSKVFGIDISPKMVELARNRIERHSLRQRVFLYEGDARNMPYDNEIFDVVYIASTLELFDTPDIPRVLNEIKRVLKPTGRLGVVSIPKEGFENLMVLKLYEWFHKKFPNYASCRPIYVEDTIHKAGYKILRKKILMLGKLFPMKIIIARPLK
jgi:demethylmenaquinone methyltransferase/2-methoxy-6-polyprenyl-1,4-benzoquinol methylase